MLFVVSRFSLLFVAWVISVLVLLRLDVSGLDWIGCCVLLLLCLWLIVKFWIACCLPDGLYSVALFSGFGISIVACFGFVVCCIGC